MTEKDPLKTIYRGLMRRFHPDVTVLPHEKVIFGKLAQVINEAYANGDLDTLIEIERLGVGYRRQSPFEPPPNERESAPQPHQRRSPPESEPVSAKKHWLWAFLPLLFPYSLAFAVKTWNENGKLINAICIAVAIPWMWVGMNLWDWISALSTWLLTHGYPHESLAGLGVVLLRGVSLIVILPIVVPLGLVALRVGWLLISVWIAHWALAGIFGISPIPQRSGDGRSRNRTRDGAMALWRSLDEW